MPSSANPAGTVIAGNPVAALAEVAARLQFADLAGGPAQGWIDEGNPPAIHHVNQRLPQAGVSGDDCRYVAVERCNVCQCGRH